VKRFWILDSRLWIGRTKNEQVFRLALCSLLFALSPPVGAQQSAKIPRIGYVSGTGSSSDPGPYVEALRQGLRDLGHIDGQNIVIEFRGAEGNRTRIPSLVAELVQLKVDVLVGGNFPAASAAKQATKTIPIVMVTNEDPVATKLIGSLAQPGGNITGIATLQRELGGKRLELLKETVPRISRIGVLREADSPTSAIGLKEYESAARALKIELQSMEVREPNPDIDRAFQTAAKGRASGLITITNPLLLRYTKRIAALALKHQFPSMYEGTAWVEDGGLMSFSTDDLDVFRRLATFVDKILKGARPADLPVEQPTKFELAINLKTARQIGLTIPPHVLARADRVIK
jgi:putative ABC transport system substrate-binding protein